MTCGGSIRISGLQGKALELLEVQGLHLTLETGVFL